MFFFSVNAKLLNAKAVGCYFAAWPLEASSCPTPSLVLLKFVFSFQMGSFSFHSCQALTRGEVVVFELLLSTAFSIHYGLYTCRYIFLYFVYLLLKVMQLQNIEHKVLSAVAGSVTSWQLFAGPCLCPGSDVFKNSPSLSVWSGWLYICTDVMLCLYFCLVRDPVSNAVLSH